MKFKKILAIPLILASGFLGFLIFKEIAVTPEVKLTPTPIPTATIAPSAQTVSLNIVFAPGRVSHYTQNYTASESALSLLQSVGAQSGLPIEVKQYPFGTLVESINGNKNSANQAWIYFVNDQSASMAADAYILKPGDKIEWKYTNPF